MSTRNTVLFQLLYYNLSLFRIWGSTLCWSKLVVNIWADKVERKRGTFVRSDFRRQRSMVEESPRETYYVGMATEICSESSVILGTQTWYLFSIHFMEPFNKRYRKTTLLWFFTKNKQCWTNLMFRDSFLNDLRHGNIIEWTFARNYQLVLGINTSTQWISLRGLTNVILSIGLWLKLLLLPIH